ncbi:MAG: anthranilate phosphoribosyltransferase [Candidatus Aminicenantes bacterium]|nr:MAG: anthranilate phosphoribosyltransferase [Candidatus Aminicenantes bacterium]
MEMKDMIRQAVEGRDLNENEAAEAMRTIMSGAATDAQIAGFLIALRLKGETVDEIAGLASVMREMATRIPADPDVIDTCGTGGDASCTFNISTGSALVAAGIGLKVAKHGNRAISSSSGSADVLKELGVNLDASVETVARCIEEAGIGFLFAVRLHAAMKYVMGPRREMGVRTVFNVLGPLTNPAGARRQVMGVFSRDLTETLGHVLQQLGAVSALVVHGHDGLDEITITDATTVTRVDENSVETFEVTPEELGLSRCKPDDLTVASPEEAAAALREVLSGAAGARRDIVLANAAAAAVVGGKAVGLAEGVVVAAESIDSGRAAAALDKLVEITNAAGA